MHQFKKLAKRRFALGFTCFSVDEYPGINLAGNEDSSPVYSCKFGHSKNTQSLLALAYEDGKILIQDAKVKLENNTLIEKGAHSNAIFEISWVPNKNELISAVADSTLCLWSLKDDLIPIQRFNGHTKSVKCVDVNFWDSNVFGSGGRDCNIFVWDVRCHRSNKANEIIGAHQTSQKSLESPRDGRSCPSQVQNSIISVLFSQEHRLVSAGASDGQIKIWDLRKTYSRGKREPQSLHVLDYNGNSSFKGYTSMCLSPYGERIYVSCLDGNIYAYHLTNPTLNPVAEYYGHRPNTYYAKTCLSPCGSYLLSGSSDDKAYIWLTDDPGPPIASLTGHTDEVTSVAWSSFGEGALVTCSDDLNHRVYRPKFYEKYPQEINPYLRGFAVPYIEKSSQSASIKKERINDLSVRRISSSCGIILNTIRPRINNSHNLPQPQFSFNKSSDSANRSLRSTLTPSTSSKKVPVTPRSSERRTLMSWLSSSKKTPQNHSASKTPTSESTARKKTVFKRKLTDLMEEDQENILDEAKNKSPTSPSKSVLTERDNLSLGSTNTVAKMLKYDQSHSDVPQLGSSHANCDELENFKLLEEESYECKVLSNGVKKDSETPIKSSFSPLVKNHLSPMMTSSLLSSPTANLPNYRLDGRSPHNRPEIPVVQKRQPDWLTSLGQKKSKSAQEIKTNSDHELTNSKGNLSVRRSKRKATKLSWDKKK